MVHPAVFFLLLGIVALITFIMTRYLKALAVSRSVPSATAHLENNLELVSWVTGGSYRVMQLWFAALVAQDVLKETKKNEFDVVRDNLELREDMPSLAATAGVLPNTVQRAHLTKYWRTPLQNLENDVLTKGLAVVVPRDRLTVARLLQVVLFCFHIFILWKLEAPWQAWTGTLLFWFLGSPWLLFNSLKPRPASFAGSFVQAKEKSLPPLSESASESGSSTTLLPLIAFSGPNFLMPGPYDHLVLPTHATVDFFGITMDVSVSGHETGGDDGDGDGGGGGD